MLFLDLLPFDNVNFSFPLTCLKDTIKVFRIVTKLSQDSNSKLFTENQMVSLDIKMANLETKYCIYRQCLTFSSISKTFFQLLACKYGHLFAQPWHQMYFAPTHHQSCMSVCLRPLPTLQNEPVPQVLKQVVNLCCYLWNTGLVFLLSRKICENAEKDQQIAFKAPGPRF